MLRALLLASVLAVPAAPSTSSGQGWPAKPIHIVVPNSAGSVGEVILHALTPPVEARLGQRFLVDNKPGAAGNIGTAEVARAAPDGYTLLLAPTANYAVNQHLFKDLGFDPLAALEPIAVLAEAPLLAVVNADVPARSLEELAAYIRANPGKLNFGAPGTGSPSHLTGALFSQMTGNAMVYIPYKGIAPMVQALMANDIQLTFPTMTTVLGALKSNRLRVLAVMARSRLPELPDVPTSVEAGFPDLVFGNWWALAAPRGTDARILDRLSAEIGSALADPGVRKRIVEVGHVPTGLRRADVAAFMRSESARYKAIVETGRIKPEL
jgi:tripartite-type tricarboxylate transporter receptor subunit TctC